MVAMVRWTSTGAKPTEGSSTSRVLGAVISARPSASICCSPPLMLPASCRRRSRKRGKASKQKSRLRRIRSRASGRKAPSIRFSSTVSLGNRRRPSGTSAMPSSTIASVSSPTSSCRSPSISAMMLPALGFTMPTMHLSSVLLPLPLVPSSATVSPDGTSSETPSSARTAPYPASTPLKERLLAKVGLLHLGVAHDLLGEPVRYLTSGHQHHQPVGEVHHGAHDVLDQDDGDPRIAEAPQQRQNVVDLGV